jgi:xanthine dehydrogenase accessory factor
MRTAREIAQSDWATYGLAGSVIPSLERARRDGEQVALVTLFRGVHAGPWGVGAQMAITRHSVSGFVSGGCIEADVAEHALATIEDGAPRWLIYGQGGPIDIRLPCGGRIELLVERIEPEDESLSRLLSLSIARRPALWLSDGSVRLCVDGGEVDRPVSDNFVGAWKLAREARNQAGCDDVAGMVFHLARPTSRVLVVGHDPTALAIASLAKLTGCDVTLVRPMGPEEGPPIPGIGYVRSGAAEAFLTIGLDPWTSVVVATHDADDDHEALLAALPSAVGYVGLLGSRRRLEHKLARLRSAGVSDLDIQRLKAPIGLPIRARSPWEVATSVMAEITQDARRDESRDDETATASAAA